MKLIPASANRKSIRAVLLLECMVYLSVFCILTGLGFAAFYLMWNNATSLRRTADSVSASLRAGEVWRTDVHKATATIHVLEATNGTLLVIPTGRDEIIYRFSDAAVERKTGALPWYIVLSRVKTSQMVPERRNGIAVWHWDLMLDRTGTHRAVPLLFSFEAVAPEK